MRFDERMIGDYRIYTGAVEARQGDGYIGALVVEEVDANRRHPAREVLRDESLACGHRWASAEEALAYALQKARAMIRERSAAVATC